MTVENVVDYLANECGVNPLFASYDNIDIGTIHLVDDEGNRFEVKVNKED